MCVTYCHRRQVLYWNHDPCSFEVCPIVAEQHGRCGSCQHRQDERCSLTRAPLPTEEGCCHWNASPVWDAQVVTLEMLALLGIERNETIVENLDSLNAPYQVDAQGQVWIEPSRLGLPFTYGLGTDQTR